jgi:hypothetical protein
MGDTYNIQHTQAGAIGKNASAVYTTFNNNKSQELHADLVKQKTSKGFKVKELLKRLGDWMTGVVKAIVPQWLTRLITKG